MDKLKIRVYLHFSEYLMIRQKIFDSIDKKLEILINNEDYNEAMKIMDEIEIVLKFVEETDKKFGLDDDED